MELAALSLLTALIKQISDPIEVRLHESMGLDIKAVTVTHNGQEINFNHQLWQIKYKSVCSDKYNNLQEYSKCTIAAKDYFLKACKAFNTKQSNKPENLRIKNMICQASYTYKPTVAYVNKPKYSGELREIRAKCNELTLEVMDNFDPKIIKEKNKVCGKYKKMKETAL